MVGSGGEGDEGKKYSRRAVLFFTGVSVLGILGNLAGDLPRASFLAIYRDLGVAWDKKEDQCVFLAFLIALKYPDFDSLATSWSTGRPDFRALRAAH